jgi:hypothetical protein
VEPLFFGGETANPKLKVIKVNSSAQVDDDTSSPWPVFDWRLFILLLAVQDHGSALPA